MRIPVRIPLLWQVKNRSSWISALRYNLQTHPSNPSFPSVYILDGQLEADLVHPYSTQVSRNKLPAYSSRCPVNTVSIMCFKPFTLKDWCLARYIHIPFSKQKHNLYWTKCDFSVKSLLDIFIRWGADTYRNAL